MGILESGLLGPFRNKVGPAVGRKHMGKDLILSAYHATTKKPTAAQLSERRKFGLLNGFLSDIITLVRPGFKKYAKRKSAKNAAFSYNYDQAFIANGESWELNYPAMVYSRGAIAAPYGLTLDLQGDLLSFGWSAQPQSAYCQHTDLASFLVYCPAQRRLIIRSNAAERKSLGFTMQLPNDFAGVLHCYISFTSADGKITGDSKYAGSLD